MRLNNWSSAAAYDTARIFAGLGFGSSAASRRVPDIWLVDEAPEQVTARLVNFLAR